MIWSIFYESSFVTYHRLEWDNGEQGRRDIEMINGGVDWIDHIQRCPFTFYKHGIPTSFSSCINDLRF